MPIFLYVALNEQSISKRIRVLARAISRKEKHEASCAREPNRAL